MFTTRASARLLARTSLFAAATFALAQPVLAQDAAQDAASAEGGTEIIVTAQKRAQSLSDVSLSVA
ncbi:MAG: hypothetical protein VW891_15825, partial [Novosphingobium sp.]